MIKLRSGQIEVADFRQGYMAVPAVPGAGKTTVLAYLAANLIEEGWTGKGKILIVTYMNSAVSNFRAKIGDYLAERGLSRNRGYEVRTLHSLALNILKEKPEFLLINDQFNIIEPALRGRLIKQLIEEWIRDNSRTFLKYFDYDPNSQGYQLAVKRWKEDHFPALIKAMIGQFKLHGLNRDQVSELRRNYRQNSYLDWAFSIYINYDRIMHKQGLLDFDDLAMQALHLLEKDQQLLARMQEKYSYVFEDEAQDSNLLLGKILSLLAGKKGNLVRVGDSNQAIMGTFTNADPQIFRNFTARNDIAKRSILYSSRSSQEIIKLANYLVKWTVNDHPQQECKEALEEKYIYPVAADDPYPNPQTDGYTIANKVFNTSRDEMKNVTRLAARHVQENPENTVAILVPANYIMEEIIEELEEQGVKYESLNEPLQEKLKTIEDFKRVLYYLAEPNRQKVLIEILKEVLLIDYLEEGKDLDFLDQLSEKYSVEEIVYPIGGSVRFQEYARGIVSGEMLAELVKALNRLRLWIDASVELPPDELILLIAEQLRLKEEELAVAQNIALQIKAELDSNPHWKLHEIADELPRLENSFRQFARKIYERKGYEPQAGVITITTFHKSKGLEWDTVYITYLTNDNFPSSVEDKFRSEYYYLEDDYSNPVANAKASLENLIYDRESVDPQQEANIEFIKERLRLLYVAITRAKKNLLLTAHREIIYDNGDSKQVKPARPFLALSNFIDKEREAYAQH
ncbi:ATP-dependent helicase [Halocella sp. SP3-1]|uniref:ATP-dependent helicase n=1 Tax=Halocella sp. SP3-1 TaxID=2382161 RepID=UPI000F756418|nr:ATP-dependent helicase [Halocella sp. SP3-1]AZO94623.1 ATP-dependent helicase [Halocella sp. SP3-1]